MKGPDGRQAIALTPKDYELLTKNMAEVVRYMREADKQLNYYRSR